MTTIRSRSLVSLAAALTLTVALGGCAGNTARSALNDPAPVAARPATIRFDNEARQYVHVYLVGQNQQWLLGRVEPGARATLRIPAEALSDETWQLQLAVLAGQRVTMRVATQPGALASIAQPAKLLQAQRWTFTQPMANGQSTAQLLSRMLGDVGRQ
ncbi:MAG: hypothetical protein JF589_12985 [Gemmatimonadetes bacterium]|nr:hypothetical protein [Gemmatimonadota bacterium]